jgi:hypothetical protein
LNTSIAVPLGVGCSTIHSPFFIFLVTIYSNSFVPLGLHKVYVVVEVLFVIKLFCYSLVRLVPMTLHR